MDNYGINNEKNNNNYICPYCNSPKIMSNVSIDSNFVSLINSLSSCIKAFYENINKILNDMKSVNSSLGSQTNHSKYLIKGISIKNSNYIERYRQLCDRIDMISESKKVLDDNFSLIYSNLNIFISESKQIFRKIKILKVRKITETINKNNNYLEQFNNMLNNNIFSENNELNINNYNRNDYMKIQKNYLFNSKNNEDGFTRKVLSSNLSPKNKLDLSGEDSDYNKNIENIEYLVNQIKVNELKKKNNNNMLIFPNNINQNIFNCTITSREFNNINNNRNIEYFNRIKNKTFNTNKLKKIKEQIFSRNNTMFENKNINTKKINRSSSIPEMQFKNRKNTSILSSQNISQKDGYNKSLPKQYNQKNLINQNDNNKINNSYNKVSILILCNKVKEFLNCFNNNYFENKTNFDKKKSELNNLVNNLLKGEKENYRREINNQQKETNYNLLKSNNKIKNNNDNLKLIKSLKDKINQLENKINEKDILLEEYKKKVNDPISQKEKIYMEKNNKILELNNNIKKLKNENNDLKNNIINLKTINNQGEEKLKEIIKNNNDEIEQLKLKITDLDSNRELSQKNENEFQNKKQELNNEIENLKKENNKKGELINELTKSLKEYEEQKIKEDNLLKDENIALKNKIEEYKNSLIEKNRKIQKINEELDAFKMRKHSIDEAKNNSQLVMEIASLKRMNSTLNKKINEMKKKNNNKQNANNTNNNYIPNDTSSSKDINTNKLNEKIKNISMQNKDLTEQINNLSLEKQKLEALNKDKNLEINKMQTLIDELNKKIIDIQTNNNNIEKIKKNTNEQNGEQSIILTENSNEIVNYNSKEIKNKDKDKEEYQKENEELKKKLKALTIQFDKYKNETQIELSIYKNEFQALKKENIKLNSHQNTENIKNSIIYTPDNYNILCDKNYEKLQWFLLIPKDIEFDNTYDNLIWVEKDNLSDIDKFNKFESEIDFQNKTIINYIKKLEQKEEIISNLSLKYKKSDSSNNNHSSSNFDNGIFLEKFNIVVNKLNDAESKIKILQIENRKLKSEKNAKKKYNSKIKESTEESNDLGYNKNYVLNIKEDEKIEDIKKDNNELDKEESAENESENYSETNTEISELKNELENFKIENDRLINEYKILENKMKMLKETFSSLLIKMAIPKKYKEEIKEILKLFDFTEGEILFIVDKKKQYY